MKTMPQTVPPLLRDIVDMLAHIEQLTAAIRIDPELAQLPEVLTERQVLLGDIALRVAELNRLDPAWNSTRYEHGECAELMQEKKQLVAAIAAADQEIERMITNRMSAINAELGSMQKSTHAARRYISHSHGRAFTHTAS